MGWHLVGWLKIRWHPQHVHENQNEKCRAETKKFVTGKCNLVLISMNGVESWLVWTGL